MKKYSCPHCQTTTSVIRKTKRGKSIRYFCKACTKYFSISPHFFNTIALLNDHLDGLSFRKLAAKYNISKSHAWDICNEQLQRLPDNNQFTLDFPRRWWLMGNISRWRERSMDIVSSGALTTSGMISPFQLLHHLRITTTGHDTSPTTVSSAITLNCSCVMTMLISKWQPERDFQQWLYKPAPTISKKTSGVP